jgi:hypothetical protein
MTTMEFKQNWAFSETYMPDIKAILKRNAMHIVTVDIAPDEDDMKRSTDLKIRVSSGDVAVRIRRASYNPRYRDLTIRAKNGNAKTEIHKLREGYADWYLYLWTDDFGICDWVLVDIHRMRESGLLNESRPVKMNKDGYTGFCCYPVDELQSIGAIVARK